MSETPLFSNTSLRSMLVFAPIRQFVEHAGI